MIQDIDLTAEDISGALVRAGEVPEGDPDGLGRAISGIMTGRVTMSDLRGIGPDELDAAFARGYAQFKAGRVDEAEKTFSLLCLMDHRVRKYWMALGAARFNLGSADGAVAAYALAAIQEPEDVEAPLRAAECLLKLGEDEKAKDALRTAIANAGDSPRHADLKARAQSLLDLVAEVEG